MFIAFSLSWIVGSDERDIVDDLNYNYYELEGCPGDQPEIDDGEMFPNDVIYDN